MPADTRQTKTDSVVETLRGRVGDGTYTPGSVLPAERELTEEFGVSRVTVRNALERLERLRLVRREPGRGTFVLGHDGGGHIPRQVPSTVALLCSQLTPSVASPIAAGCSSAATAHRSQLLLCDTGGATFAEAQAKELLHLKTIYEQGVQGLLIWWQEGEASATWLSRMLADGRAVVMIDRYVPGVGADFVGIDDPAATAEAMGHLIQLGHRRIACVLNTLRVSTSAGRLAGYRSVHTKHGIPIRDEYVHIVEDWRADSAARIVDSLLGLAEPPTGILAVNDYVAVQIIEALAGSGVRVPQDCAVVSFADMEIAQHYCIPLTTVHQPFRAMGETAIHLLSERLETGRKEPRRVLLPTHLVVRRSFGSRP